MKVFVNALQAGNRSGTGRYTYELVRWLPSVSQDIDFIVAWPDSIPHPELEHPERTTFMNINTHGHFSRIIFDQFTIKTKCEQSGAGAVHYPANFGRFGSQDNMVVTVHDLSYMRHPEWFRNERAIYYRYAVKCSVRNASRIIVDSKTTAIDLAELVGADENKIDVVPLGVNRNFHPADVEKCGDVKKKYDLPDDFLLFMATIEPRKNVINLIKAWSNIAHKCSFDLVIAGRNGWKVNPILKTAAESSHKDRIHFPGFIDDEDQAAILSAAHAFVWPALWEGFGLPPLEAMACGTPVLTSNLSSLPETVGDAALMVNPHNIDAIAKGIMDISTDTELRETLVKKGLERAAKFTWKRTAELTLNTYRTVLEG